jgi:putative membrane protein
MAPLRSSDNRQLTNPELQSEQRTDLAEDRTILANERTFASWFRTGFAAVGIGLGFQALFVRMEPSWVPRVIATLFLLLGIFLFVAAERRACEVFGHLKAHEVKGFGNARLRLMTIAASAGVLALIAAMWLLPIRPA